MGEGARNAGLEEQQARLAAVQRQDFRAVNLFRLVAERLGPGDIIDVGCGAGGFVAWLLQQSRNASGFDVSAATVTTAQNYLRSVDLDPERIAVGSLGSLIAEQRCAANVVSMDCLEHISDHDTAAAQLVQLVEPGGRLLVTVPAIMALYGERDRRIGHHRRYDRDQLRALFAGQPLRIDEIRYWNLLGVGPTFFSNRVLGRAVDESFRYGEPTRWRRMLRAGLFAWFRLVESRIEPPFGLTLMLRGTRLSRPTASVAER